MAEKNVGQALLDQLQEDLGFEPLSVGLYNVLSQRLQSMYETEGSFFGNNQIAAVLRGAAGTRDRLESVDLNDIISTGQAIGNAKEKIHDPEPQVVISMDELAGYDSDEPFFAGDDNYRFEFDLLEADDETFYIDGFSEGDTLAFFNPSTGPGDFSAITDEWDNGESTIVVPGQDQSFVEIQLMGLESDYFWNADSFTDIYGDNSLYFA